MLMLFTKPISTALSANTAITIQPIRSTEVALPAPIKMENALFALKDMFSTIASVFLVVTASKLARSPTTISAKMQSFRKY